MAAVTPSCLGLVTTRVRCASSARAAASDQSNIGRPATGCSTLGILEFIRTPLPAASTTTVTPPRLSGDWVLRDPADALARMGGIAAIISRRSQVSGGEIVDLGRARLPIDGRSDPAPEGRTDPVETPAKLVAIALNRVLDRKVGQLTPGKTLQQVPGRPPDEVPRVRPQ